jgi:hypothetical protein
MSDRTIFNPQAPFLDTLRREWVELDGGWVCVREMQAADSLFIMEHSSRPGRNELDMTRYRIWRIVVSCYKGEEPGAERTFGLTDLDRVQKLRAAEWAKLIEAIDRVNGLADEEVSAAQDFTEAPEEPSSETSPSGVSRISIASLPN